MAHNVGAAGGFDFRDLVSDSDGGANNGHAVWIENRTVNYARRGRQCRARKECEQPETDYDKPQISETRRKHLVVESYAHKRIAGILCSD